MHPILWAGLIAGGSYLLYRIAQNNTESDNSPFQTAQPSTSPKSEQENKNSANRSLETEYAHKPTPESTPLRRIPEPVPAAESEIAIPVSEQGCLCESHVGKPKKDYWSVESAEQAINALLAEHGFVMEHYPCPERKGARHLRSMRFETREEADAFWLRHHELGFYWEVQERKGRFYLEPLTFDSKTHVRECIKNLRYIRGIEMHFVEDKGDFRLTKNHPKKSVH
ncbi:MAG: hypothetical protein ACR2QC_00760 [Gammaproteobacteria bacterium]